MFHLIKYFVTALKYINEVEFIFEACLAVWEVFKTYKIFLEFAP